MYNRFISLTLLLPLLLIFDGWGQVNITAGSTYTQDFSIGTSAIASLPSGWKMDKNSSARLVGSYSSAVSATELRAGNSMSSSAGNGIYNYGAGDATTVTDRAVGGISSSSSSKSVNAYVYLKNDGSEAITSFTISYAVEKYRNGSNAAGYSIQMYYSTDGSTWTSAGADFLTSFSADANNNGFATAPGTTVNVSSKTLSVGLAASANLYLAWNYSVTSGTTTSNAQALGIDDVSIVAVGSTPTLDPPTLTADATDNTVDNNMEITFTDDATWRAAVTAVKVNGTTLASPAGYEFSAGTLTLKPAGSTALQSPGSKSVVVEATGYNNATVTQVINVGVPTATNSRVSGTLSLGTTSNVTLTAKDQYNNLVSGYIFKYNGARLDDKPYQTELYKVDSQNWWGSVPAIACSTATNASGVATVPVEIPAIVDQDDGLAIQFLMNDGTTSLGSQVSFFGPTPTVTYTGDDPTTNSFAIPSDANALYRVKLDVTNNPVELGQFTFNVQGNYASADINTFELWYSANSTLEPASDAGLGQISPSGDGSQTLSFNLSPRQFMSTGTHYLFLTVSVGGGRGSDITVSPKPAFTDIQFLEVVNSAGTFGDANVHTFLAAAPALTADNTNNTVDNQIDITFSDDNWWGNVTDVKVNGTSLADNDWDIERGHLYLNPSNSNPLLTTSGEKTVAVDATDYATASVTQTILPGAVVAANSTVGVSSALTLGGTSTATLTAKDQYSNLVPGYVFKYDVDVTNSNPLTTESYTIAGSGVTSDVTDVSATATNASGVSTFDIIIPGTVDANDGFSLQVQLNDGSTNVGAPVTFGNTPGVTITGTDPGTGKFVRSNTQQVLYRYQIAVTKASVTLNQVVAALSGTYTADDLGPRSLKLYYSNNTTLDGADPQIGSSVSPVSTGSGESITFASIGKMLPIGTSYVFLTTDVKYDATLGRTIAGRSSEDAQLTFAETVNLTPGTYGAGNPHEITKIPGAPTDLIISEYVEGSVATEKYLEIFNGTGESITLNGYTLRLHANGSSGITNSLALTGSLANNSVLVIKGTTGAVYAGTATYSTAANFNGDDAVSLIKGVDEFVDIFGKIGYDPGTDWQLTGGTNKTADRTLRRKSSVSSGITANPSSNSFPTLDSEWDMFADNNIDGLGSHTLSLNTGTYSQSVSSGANNYAFIGTGVQINFVNVTTGATVTVTRYEGAPTGTAGITELNVSGFRWVIEDDGIALGDPATLRFKASSLTGITDPTTATIKLYKRSTPGSGTFTLVGTLTYDAATDEFFVSGVTSFSEFVMASEGSPLPVELTSFTAKASSTSVTLNWETKTEIDNNGFEVERNANGTWQKIGFVEGHGTANSPKYYSFSDANPLGNKIQYRLKQIDNDGSFEYSPVVEVELAPVTYTLYQNYPNPFNPSTVIRYALPAAGMVTIDVFNALGEKVATLLNGEVEAGYNQVSFDATNLPSGLYFYRIQSGDFTSIKKMLLMK